MRFESDNWNKLKNLCSKTIGEKMKVFIILNCVMNNVLILLFRKRNPLVNLLTYLKVLLQNWIVLHQMKLK